MNSPTAMACWAVLVDRRAIITLQKPTASAASDSGHHSIPPSLIPTAATAIRTAPVNPASPKVGSATSATMRADASTTQTSTTAGSFATSITARA